MFAGMLAQSDHQIHPCGVTVTVLDSATAKAAGKEYAQNNFSIQSALCGGSVTRSTGRREYLHVGLTAAVVPAAGTCQSSHRTSFPILKKLLHTRS